MSACMTDSPRGALCSNTRLASQTTCQHIRSEPSRPSRRSRAGSQQDRAGSSGPSLHTQEPFSSTFTDGTKHKCTESREEATGSTGGSALLLLIGCSQ